MIGWTDIPADLSDSKALENLTSFLPQKAPVISSDLHRAVSTADAIAADRPRLTHDPRLRELHFGDWENRGYAEVEAEVGPKLRQFWDEPGDIAPPGGESWNTVRARVDAASDALVHHSDIIVVAHMGAIMAALQRALGIPAVKAFSHVIDPLSVTQIVPGAENPAPLINHKP